MNKATFLHSAVVKQSCTSCHLPHSSKRLRLLNQEGQDLCFVCHKDIEADYKMSRSKHMALYTDNRCGNCHAVHFSELGKLLLDEEMPLCLKCHGHDDQSKSKPLRNIKKELEDKEYLHGPVADQQCIPCHSPHGSGYSKLMQGPYPGDFYAPFEQGIYDFCFECHESGMLTKREDASSTDFRNGDQNLHYLHVVKEQKGRTCQSCHATHASSGAKLISQEGVRFGSWEIPIRFNQTETGGSCTPGCHRKVDYDRESPVDYKADKKREE